MNTLLLAAVIPPLFLAFYTYRLDKIEKEPARLLIWLFVLGAAVTIPAGLIESVLDGVLQSIIGSNNLIYVIIMNFFIIALTEEGLKYLVLKRRTWNHPDFDYVFDAIVYAAITSLGFAAFENVMYVSEGGIGVAVMRAITAIPGHFIFSVFMGAFYGMYKYYSIRGEEEAARKNRKYALLVPVFIHGFYDFAATINTDLMTIVFFVFLIIVEIIAFKLIRKASRQDRPLDM